MDFHTTAKFVHEVAWTWDLKILKWEFVVVKRKCGVGCVKSAADSHRGVRFGAKPTAVCVTGNDGPMVNAHMVAERGKSLLISAR